MRLLSASLAALIVVAGAARADAAPEGTYHFSGNANGKFATGSISFVAKGTGLAVSATENRKPDVSWSGSATIAGAVVTIERDPTDTVGVVGRLEDRNVARGPHLEYVAVFDATFERAQVRVYDVTAAGARTESGSAEIERKLLPWERLPGNLLGLTAKLVTDQVDKQRDITEEFQILTYAHLGVRVAAKVIGDGERTDLMKDSDRLFRAAGQGEPVWLRTAIDGGPVVDYGLTVPIDPSGALGLNVGFHAGAHVTYICEDQYPLPAGVTDGSGALKLIEAVPAHTFFVPITADMADALPEGATRTLQGTGDLAFSAGVSVGYSADQVGAVKNIAIASADAGIGISWGLHGDLQVQVTREAEHLVRVHWTKGAQRDLVGNAHVLLGLVVSPTLMNKVSSPASKVVSAVVRRGQTYTTVDFNIGIDSFHRSELDVNMLFDLTDPKARAAYEAAVVGNLLVAQEVAAGRDPGGLKACRVTSTLTDSLAAEASLHAFKLLDWESESKSSTIKVDVATLDGTKSTTNVESYFRHVHKLFGGQDEILTADASDRTVTRPTGARDTGETLAFHYQRVDNKPGASDLADAVNLVGAVFGGQAASEDRARVAAAGNAKKMGKATLTLDIALGNTAIAHVLAAGDEAFLIAYGRGNVDRSYNWDHDRLEQLRGTSLMSKKGATAREEALRLEAWTLSYAKDALKVLQRVRAAPGADQQIQQFRKLAKEDGLQLGAVVAIAILAGQDDARTEIKLDGNATIFDRAAGQASGLPDHP